MLTMAAQEKERNTCAWSVKGKGNKWMDDEEKPVLLKHLQKQSLNVPVI